MLASGEKEIFFCMGEEFPLDFFFSGGEFSQTCFFFGEEFSDLTLGKQIRRQQDSNSTTRDRFTCM
jgi:hypothetical protein